MTNTPDPDFTTSEQLDEDELGADPLERGAEPAEGWSGADRFGTTAREQREGESLDDRLAEEEPDVPNQSPATSLSHLLQGRRVAILATDGVDRSNWWNPVPRSRNPAGRSSWFPFPTSRSRR